MPIKLQCCISTVLFMANITPNNAWENSLRRKTLLLAVNLPMWISLHPPNPKKFKFLISIVVTFKNWKSLLGAWQMIQDELICGDIWNFLMDWICRCLLKVWLPGSNFKLSSNDALALKLLLIFIMKSSNVRHGWSWEEHWYSIVGLI